MKQLILKTSVLGILLLGLQGCIMVDRDGPSHTSRGTTIGEELEDLENAHQQGLLSNREYERLRERILDL